MTSLDKYLFQASQGNFPTIESGANLDEQIDGVTLVKDADGKIKVSDDFVGSGVEIPINISDVTDLQIELDDAKKYTNDKITILLNNLEQEFTKNDHKHQISDIDGLQLALDSKTELPISADDVSESSTKQFIDGVLKAQITANTGDISGFGQRISDVENIVNGLTTTDEMVKMDVNDTSGYLADKLDGATLVNLNGKLVAVSLEGLTTTLEQLNYLDTLTGNVQSQIDSLSRLNDVGGIVDTYADLPDFALHNGKTFLVRIDETQGDNSTFYLSDGNAWLYGGTVDSGVARDFVAEPIKLTTETTEILPKTRYEKQNASETPFTDSSGNIQASNTEEAIKEVFLFSDSIRKQWSNAIGSPLTQTDKLQDQLIKYNSLIENITNAITSKGVAAYPYNKLNELPNKIIAIPNVSVATGTKKVILEDVIAPHTENIVLTEQLQLADVNTTLIEIVGGQDDVTHYDVKFEESDKNKFVENTFIEFNSGMRLKVGVDINMTNTNSQIDGYSKHVLALNESDFETYNGFKVV